MSRCFPFPPPGYVRKLRVDDGNLIAKEKDNGKKRKRDKEKKEKDKDRSKEKHRERSKDKKEKHKHKDKDENKDKDQSRDEKRFRGEGLVEKVGSSIPPSRQLTSSPPSQALGGKNGYVEGAIGNNDYTFHKRDERSDSVVPKHGVSGPESMPRFDQKVNGQRDNGDTRFPKVATVFNINGLDQRRVGAIRPVERTIDKSKKENEKDNRSGQKGEKKEEKHKDEVGKRFEGQTEIKDTRYVQTLGNNRIRDEKLANGNATAYSLHAKMSSKLANGIHKTENGERGNNESRGTEVALVHNSKGLEQRGCKVVGTSDMDKNLPIEGARRTAYGGISVFDDKEKKILPKHDEGTNAVLEDHIVKQGGDNIIKLSRLGENCKDANTVGSRQFTLKASSNGTAKRKAPEANGSIHGNEARPEKLPRTVVSSTSLVGSTKPPSSILKVGGAMDAQKSSFVAKKSLIGSTKPPAFTPKANGLMVARESPMTSTKTPSSNVKSNNGMIFTQESLIKPPLCMVDANGKTTNADGLPLDAKKLVSTSTKPKHREKSSSKPPPPHPDIKYLSHILSIPKMDVWSGIDDQDWLYEKNSNCPSKETKVGTIEGDSQVWAKAVHIEAVDLYALPYVIPY